MSINHPEAPEPNEKKINTNNFYGNLPGGFRRNMCMELRRKPDFMAEHPNYVDDKIKLFSVIDRLIKELGIDNEFILSEMEKRNEKSVQNAERTILPLFNALITLGYDEQYLIT